MRTDAEGEGDTKVSGCELEPSRSLQKCAVQGLADQMGLVNTLAQVRTLEWTEPALGSLCFVNAGTDRFLLQAG